MFILAPGYAGPRLSRLERSWFELVVAQHCDPQSVSLNDERPMGLGQIAAAAKVSEIRLLQMLALLYKCLGPKIARMIVGDTHGIKVTQQQRDAACVGAKVIRLFDFRTAPRDHALQVANRKICVRQRAREIQKRVDSLRHFLARTIVEHDVPGKHEAHRGQVVFSGRKRGGKEDRKWQRVFENGLHG